MREVSPQEKQRMLKFFLIAALVSTTAIAADFHPGTAAYQSIQSPSFQQLGVTDGIPTSRVFNIVQDRKGYIWASTENGLVRYDGYQIQVFQHKSGDADSISGNTIRGMFVDNASRLWIGAYDGTLDLYHPDTGDFSHFTPKLPNALSKIGIWTLNGYGHDLWVGTFKNGLFLFDTQTKLFTHFQHDPGETNSLADNRINNIYIAKDGRVWLSTGNGLDSYDPRSHRFIHHAMGEGSQAINVWCIIQDHNNNFWVGTNHGLYFSKNGDNFRKLAIYNDDLDLRTLVFYGNNKLWMGTDGNGIFVLNINTMQSFNLLHNQTSVTSLSSDYIWDIFKGKHNILWIATDLGISRLTHNALDISLFKDLQVMGSALPLEQITGLHAENNRIYVATSKGAFLVSTNQGKLKTRRLNSGWTMSFVRSHNRSSTWIGASKGKLLHVSHNGTVLDTYQLSKNNPDIDYITSLAEAGKSLWLGTFHMGLFRFEPKNNSLTPYVLPISDQSWKQINELRLHGSTLLIGTNAGVALLDTISGKAGIVPNPRSINGSYSVASIYQYAANQYYLGTSAGLLSAIFDPINSTLDVEPVAGLSGPDAHTIVGIEQDDDGNLWLSSDYGLLKYSPSTGIVSQFSKNQGIPLSLFTVRAHARTTDGRLWFGGPFGLVSFIPSMLENDTTPERVTISNISYSADNKTHKRPIYNTSNLSLHYNINIIQIYFSAMNYAYPEGSNYRYRLVGLTNKWVNLGTHHQLILSLLPPGSYTLELEATTTPGNWTAATPTRLGLTILPPWWRTWWAYTIYVLLILGAMFAYVYAQQRKLHREREISTKLRDADTLKSNFVKELESQVGQATSVLRNTLETVKLKNQELEIANQRASEGEQLKSQFLANMSHELRTPLTAIQGYLKLLSGTQISSEQADYLRTVQHSSESLLSIINDTLDLSRIESGKLLIDEVDFELLELIESTLELLGPSAYSKQLVLLHIIPPEIPLRLRGDPLRIRQILVNLVGNAIKFTQRGSICVRVQEIQQREKEIVLGIAVSDTGIGMPPEGIARLFQPYERHESGGQPIAEGTGLGLSICKKLLDLMGGSIEVMSTLGIGSTFEFHLPFKFRRQNQPEPVFAGHPAITLLDSHPLSHQAWRASLSRLGLDVTSIRRPLIVGKLPQGILFIVLGMDEMEKPEVLAAELQDAPLHRLLLAPTLDRSKLERLGDRFRCTALSALAHEANIASALGTLMSPAHTAEKVGTKATGHPVPSAVEHIPLILVADDNAINRKLLVTLLLQNGYRVMEAASGPALLELARTQTWDLALVDIHMPGMDGIKTTKELLAMPEVAHLPVIAVSADALPETRTHALAAGMRDYLVKPYSEPQLLEMVARYL